MNCEQPCCINQGSSTISNIWLCVITDRCNPCNVGLTLPQLFVNLSRSAWCIGEETCHIHQDLTSYFGYPLPPNNICWGQCCMILSLLPGPYLIMAFYLSLREALPIRTCSHKVCITNYHSSCRHNQTLSSVLRACKEMICLEVMATFHSRLDQWNNM